MASELRAYIEGHRDTPFDWRVNNCLTFVQGALRAAGGATLPDAWCVPANSRLDALRIYREGLMAEGAANMTDAMDARYDRAYTLHPADGLVCARPARDVLGVGFGVTVNQGCVFLTKHGARWFTVEPTDTFWVVQ